MGFISKFCGGEAIYLAFVFTGREEGIFGAGTVYVNGSGFTLVGVFPGGQIKTFFLLDINLDVALEQGS